VAEVHKLEDVSGVYKKVVRLYISVYNLSFGVEEAD
jgi:hypothetical protein